MCVKDCTVRPGFYKEKDSRVCVQECPSLPKKSYKYDVNHSCVYEDKLAGVSGCPDLYYANPLNNICTTLCPSGYFAEISSKMCVK